MKVVLFCGGLGMRMRDGVSNAPKPMAMIGERPLLWHVMRYYAYFGHKDFILCLGYGGSVVKDYFLNYDETRSNDFVLENGARDINLFSTDISDWRISFVDTGLNANVGQRLRAVRNHVGNEPFLANYGDVLTDAPLDERIERFLAGDKVASIMCVRPSGYSFHLVETEEDRVSRISDVGTADLWINGGYFIFRPEIFDYIGPGEELIQEPFTRLIAEGRLQGDTYEGYWAPMDTLKEVQALQTAFDSGRPPWALWQADEVG